MKYSSLCQCSLGSTIAALVNFNPSASPVTTVGITATLWAFEPCRPASRFKNGFTLFLIPVLIEKLVQAQAGLKLNSIHLHGNLLKGSYHGA